jgi:hypothetical protein
MSRAAELAAALLPHSQTQVVGLAINGAAIPVDGSAAPRVSHALDH